MMDRTPAFLIFPKGLKIAAYLTVIALFVACSAIWAAAEAKIVPRDPSDAHSMSTPTRPASLKSVAEGAIRSSKALTSSVVISNVPSYIWLHGCGPTAAGMVLGYWETQGYTDLVSGSASNQTTAVDQMIASTEHYEDYSKPRDDTNSVIIADGSQTNEAGVHADNCVADYFLTSRSSESLRYGWSWSSDCDDSLRDYVTNVTPSYTASVESEPWSSMSWTRLKEEIDSNHPCIFLVDTDGNGGSDHFVPIIGYGADNGTNMYACYDTWKPRGAIRWFSFRGLSSGYTYGIYGATYFSLAPLPETEPSKAINPSPTNGATGVSTSPTLTWSDGGGVPQGFDVYFGTNPSPGVIEFQGSQETVTYSPGTLDEGITYYWRIDATNTIGTTTGDIWSFTTEETVYYYVSTNGGHISPFTSWATAATNIQSAYDVAPVGAKVWVTNGTYVKVGAMLMSKNTTIESVNGPEHTIIDGQDAYLCVRMSQGTLKGFTVQNGYAGYGAAIRMDGGGLVSHCRLVDNVAREDGGGVWFDGGGTLRNTLVAGNEAPEGGGVFLKSGGRVEACTIVDNEATSQGGGVYIHGYSGSPYVRNSVIYSNTCAASPNYYKASTRGDYTNCCTTPALPGGTANITNDPAFKNYAVGDYSLDSSSACINSGSNFPWMISSTDLTGENRILDTVVDMGAYEYNAAADTDLDLTVSSDHGTPSPSVGIHSYEEGLTLTNTVDATDTQGTTQFVCAGWTMTGNNPAAGTSNAMTMAITNDAALIWLWTTNIQFTRTATAGGSVTGDTDGWYALGGSVTVTATPEANYSFVGWSGDTDGDTNDNVMTLTMDKARSISAHFALVEHMLTIVSDHGTPTPGAGIYTNMQGGSITNTVSATDVQGSTQFVNTGWTLAGHDPSSGAGQSMVMTPTNNATLTWTWTTNVQFLTSADTGGSISGDSDGWYALGGSVTVTATSEANYEFAGWSGETDGDTNDNVMTLTLDNARSISAHFALVEHTLGIESEYGTPTPDVGSYTNTHGTILTNIVVADVIQDSTQFVNTGWTLTHHDPTTGTSNSMVMTLTNSTVLTWTWTTNMQFSTSADTGGSISGDSDGWYAFGGSVTVTAAPEANYSFAGWSGDTDGDTNDNVMTLTMDNARSISAHFELVTHLLTIVSDHGSGTPAAGTHTNVHGIPITNAVSATDVQGSTQFVNTGWTMTGNDTTAGHTNLMIMSPSNDAVLTWTWITNVQLTATADAHGSLVGDTSGWYLIGGSITITAIPDSAYHFAGWSGDVPGIETNSNPLTLSLDWARDITAHFAYHDPRADNVSVSDAGVSSSWDADPGGAYQLQACTNLMSPVWFNRGHVVTAASPIVVLLDSNAADPCLVYRAVRLFP